jgi:hypothetical protein
VRRRAFATEATLLALPGFAVAAAPEGRPPKAPLLEDAEDTVYETIASDATIADNTARRPKLVVRGAAGLEVNGSELFPEVGRIDESRCEDLVLMGLDLPFLTYYS